eukprot:Hpha_TRINITY_DN14141_c1_g1::TRINITY_DN14141_c1_g1_i1::g.11044::m.11044
MAEEAAVDMRSIDDRNQAQVTVGIDSSEVQLDAVGGVVREAEAGIVTVPEGVSLPDGGVLTPLRSPRLCVSHPDTDPGLSSLTATPVLEAEDNCSVTSSVSSAILSFAATLRRIAVSVILPASLFTPVETLSFGIMAVYARELQPGDENDAVTGIVVAGRPTGTLLATLFAGACFARFGAGATGALGAVIAGIGCVLTGVTHSVPFVIFSQVVYGCGLGLWVVARTVYVKSMIGRGHRGKVMVFISALDRVGRVVMPAAAGALARGVGYESVFYTQAVCAAVTLGTLALLFHLGDPTDIDAARPPTPESRSGVQAGLLSTVRKNQGTVWRATGAAFGLSFLRALREQALPLRADDIGLGIDKVGVIQSGTAVPDLLLNLTVCGWVIDNWGRKWAGGSCMAMFCAGLAVLGLTNTEWQLWGVGMLLGAANGVSGPLIQIMSQDFSPGGPQEATFVSLVFLTANLGMCVGPVFYGAVLHLAGVRAASFCGAGVGVLILTLYLVFVPETLRKKRSRTRDPLPYSELTAGQELEAQPASQSQSPENVAPPPVLF